MKGGIDRMRMKTALALIAILIAGCDILKTKSDGNGGLTATFFLADTSGHIATVFHSGDEFVMSFSVVNTTNDTLTYHYSEPPVIFRILKDGSIVASSTDGYAFPMNVNAGFVAPGKALSGSWKAPNTPAQNPKVVLAPGTYEASVAFSQFEEAKVNPVSTITFSVIQ